MFAVIQHDGLTLLHGHGTKSTDEGGVLGIRCLCNGQGIDIRSNSIMTAGFQNGVVIKPPIGSTVIAPFGDGWQRPGHHAINNLTGGVLVSAKSKRHPMNRWIVVFQK